MIFHASVPADDPAKVARALGDAMGGYATPFPNWPGGYIARSGPTDPNVTWIEVYPRERPAIPGEGDAMVQVGRDDQPPRHTCFHLAVGTPLSKEQVMEIAAREGWRAKHLSRKGSFDLIEFWLENSVMIEFLTPEMQAAYLARVERHRNGPVQPAPSAT